MGNDVAAAWVAAFKAGWQLEDREAWFTHFEGLLADDVHLVQPMLPEARGPNALRETFEPVFAMFPELKVEVTSWAADGDEIFIAFTMGGTSHTGRTASWRAVDRITLNGEGLATLRESFFDPTASLEALQ